ncbi:MAG: acriflavine resistance protein B [Deltaproteobacteria bacterium]|nr:MAG: acriflavine resistance protein B [Deltaproteobacteria bacterium]
MSEQTAPQPNTGGFIARIVAPFLETRLSVILILVSVSLGMAAILATPREEEPQIVVPMADVFISAPGANPEEIENLVATALERMLWEVDGVEYVYSTAYPDMAVVTVRFFVGEDRENSLLKLHNKIQMNRDRVPAIVTGWVVKPVEIDDVPIVSLAFYSPRYSDADLRRIGEEVLSRLSRLKNISRTCIRGGRSREIRVSLMPQRMAGLDISLQDVETALSGADAAVTAGSFDQANRSYTVTSHAFLTSSRDVGALLIGVSGDRPVYLRDIADITDGPEEAVSYSRIGFSHRYMKEHPQEGIPADLPAVTLALAKKKGTNAVSVSEDILNAVTEMKGNVIPDDVYVQVIRNYGQTAREKVNGLLSSLLFAVTSVVILLAIVLGWREATVVALAVPLSFSLALFVNYMFGYTINRVTLFALILSLGLVVDDPITNVDNIQRHIFSGRFLPREATLFAVGEVLPPVILSTIAIIICFVPLFFITGMMGPYMAPMAANVPLTVTFSTLCALTVVPWLSHLLLKNMKPRSADTEQGKAAAGPDGGWTARVYRSILTPFLTYRSWRWLLLVAVLVLMAGSVSLALFRLVPLKLLPFDNKNEFQIVIDMPEGTTLETTDRVSRQFEAYLKTVPEVTHTVAYVGMASPMDFNGMVRHYYLREGSHVADIRINFAGKDRRKQQSHAIVLRLRNDLEAIAKKTGAEIQIVEVPPGPPVLSTLVAEIYGAPGTPYDALIAGARQIRALMADEPFVTDITDMTETPRDQIELRLDKEKAALHGIDTRTVLSALKTALSGSVVATAHLPGERYPLSIRLILPREERSGATRLAQIPVKSSDGHRIPLGELVEIRKKPHQQPIFHKNLERVVYVLGEMAGRAPAEAIIDMMGKLKKKPLPDGISVKWSGEGEWKITIRVFRDMGIAFAAALLGIYLLLVINTGSYSMPLLIMMAIPLTILGIMPGFFILNLFSVPVGGYENPVFFTATSMIGMIALGGIVIRNSLVLIEFIQDALKQGIQLKEAILQSGVIRMRPILLTAATTAIGAFPITFDPVFSGLAWALIFGLLASTLFTLLVIPVTYYALTER